MPRRRRDGTCPALDLDRPASESSAVPIVSRLHAEPPDPDAFPAERERGGWIPLPAGPGRSRPSVPEVTLLPVLRTALRTVFAVLDARWSRNHAAKRLGRGLGLPEASPLSSERSGRTFTFRRRPSSFAASPPSTLAGSPSSAGSGTGRTPAPCSRRTSRTSSSSGHRHAAPVRGSGSEPSRAGPGTPRAAPASLTAPVPLTGTRADGMVGRHD